MRRDGRLKPMRWRLGAILLVVVAAGSACGTSAARSPSPSASPSATSTPTPTPACADRVFQTMTSDQRIGQLFELGLAGDLFGPPASRLLPTTPTTPTSSDTPTPPRS